MPKKRKPPTEPPQRLYADANAWRELIIDLRKMLNLYGKGSGEHMLIRRCVETIEAEVTDSTKGGVVVAGRADNWAFVETILRNEGFASSANALSTMRHPDRQSHQPVSRRDMKAAKAAVKRMDAEEAEHGEQKSMWVD